MKNYQLQPDEIVFYKGKASIKTNGEDTACDLIVTNKNIVFITQGKKTLFNKSGIIVECFAINTVKIYKDTPQIIQNVKLVEIYFIKGEYEITFENKNEAHKFTSKALEAVTGKTAFVRGVEKVKKTIDTIDENLGVNVIDVAANAVQMKAQKKSASDIALSLTTKILTSKSEKSPKQISECSTQDKKEE